MRMNLRDTMKNTLKPIGRAFTSDPANGLYIIAGSCAAVFAPFYLASALSGPETRPTQDDFAGKYHMIERGSGRIGLERGYNDDTDVDAIIYHRSGDASCIEALAAEFEGQTFNLRPCLGGSQVLSTEERASWSKIALELDNARFMRAVNDFDYRAAKKAEREAKK